MQRRFSAEASRVQCQNSSLLRARSLGPEGPQDDALLRSACAGEGAKRGRVNQFSDPRSRFSDLSCSFVSWRHAEALQRRSISRAVPKFLITAREILWA